MNPRDRAAALLVLATAAFAAFALGATPRWAALVAAGMGVLSAAPYVGSRRALGRHNPLLLLLGAAIAATVFQVIPLPLVVVGWISPAKLALVAENARAVGGTMPLGLALSYDPPASLLEIAKLVGFAGVAYASLRVSSSSAGRRLLATGLGCIGLVMVVVLLLHKAFGTDQLYGIYQPRYAHPTHLAPFLNPNHLVGFLALLAPICVGLAAQAIGARRVVWGLIALLLGAASLLPASRAGTVALVIGFLVTLGLLQLQASSQKTDQPRQPSTIIGVVIVVVCAVVVIAALTGGRVLDQMAATSQQDVAGGEGKVAAWRAAMTLLADHWLTGVGRGGFEAAFAKVHGLQGSVYSHLENEYLQAPLDWGVPIAAFLGVLGVLLARRIARRWRSGPLEAGAIGGLVAIALHNVLDFSLAFAGVGVSAVVVAALVARGKLATATASPRLSVAARRAGLLVAGAAVVVVASSPLAATAREEVAELRVDWSEHDYNLDGALEGWHRHPADHVSAGYVAMALFVRGDLRAVPVIGRALDLNPRHPDLHALAADILIAAREEDQALIELRLALSHSQEEDRDALLERLTREFRDPAIALGGLPPDPDLFDDLIERLLKQRQLWLALAYARQVTALQPRDGNAWQEVSRLAGRLRDQKLAIDAGRKALRHAPDAESAVVLAAALTESGDAQKAIDVLRTALEQGYPQSRTVTEVELLRGLGDALLAIGRKDEAFETLTRALGMAGTSKPRQAAVHRSLAAVEDAMGNPNKASWHRRQAGPN